MTVEEILQITDISQRIAKIKELRKTELPDRDALLKDWDPMKHDVMDKELRPDEVKVIEEEKRDPVTGKVIQRAITKTDPVNRIPLPIEQDITNIHTSFTVGTEPKLTCETEDAKEKELFAILHLVNRKNKMKYVNKRVVRSWLSEQEVAEYWYTVEDKRWWKAALNKLKNSVGVKTYPERKLRCAIWSPFRGDKLYPVFDDSGDYKALGREYQVKVSYTQIDTYFMFVTDKEVYVWQQGQSGWKESKFLHKFKKNPTIYSYRPETLCKKIKPIRVRLETLASNYGDCLDYNFAPKLVSTGQVTGNHPKWAKGGFVELANGGDLKYLSWQQTPEAVKFEFDSLTERAYSLTNTPRISFENLQGLGNSFSGVSFKYAFMAAHMAVEMHAETMGEHLQRRYNFLCSAIGSINTAYEQAAETIDVDVEIVPYMINNRSEAIKDAVDSFSGGVASRKTGIVLAGLIDQDKIDEELKEIESDQEKEKEESLYPRSEEI